MEKMTSIIGHLDSELIIIAVEKFPCIYNTKDLSYKNRAVKVQAWKTVCQEVIGNSWDTLAQEEHDQIGKEVQKRWKNMRDAYKRSISDLKNSNKSGSATSNKKPYLYHRQMAFLKNAMELRPTQGNMNDNGLTGTAESETMNPLEENSRTETLCPATIPPKARKRKHQDPFERDLIKVLSSTMSPPEQNPDAMFLNSLMPHITSLSNDDKLDFQIKTLQLLKSYQCAVPRVSAATNSSSSSSASHTCFPAHPTTAPQSHSSTSTSPSMLNPNFNYDSSMLFSPVHSEDDQSILSFNDY